MSRDASALKLTEADQRKLYDLIWKRTLACQMAAARLERTTVEVSSADGQVGLRASGQVVLFDGFLKVYEEGRDDSVGDDEKRLPQVMQGEAATKKSVSPDQHFTQPPPRSALLPCRPRCRALRGLLSAASLVHACCARTLRFAALARPEPLAPGAGLGAASGVAGVALNHTASAASSATKVSPAPLEANSPAASPTPLPITRPRVSRPVLSARLRATPTSS